MLLYFGPETLLPAASVVAGAAGVALMFGRRTISSVRALFDRITRRGRARPAERGSARRRGSP